jgi:peptide/nickel transport system permease protein
MIRYLLRRTLHALVLLFGVSLLTFLFAAAAPGNYLDEMRLNPQVAPETITALRVQYGFDRPLPVRYWRWLGSLMRGEMGFSFAYNRPVAPLLAVRARNTLLLTATATVLAWGLALPLGVCSAKRTGGWPDRLITAATAALLAIPELVLALGLLMFAVRSGWFPAGGMESVRTDPLSLTARVADLVRHMILPVAALVLGSCPTLIRHVRAALLDTLGEGYLLAAQAHGISPRRLLWRYALPAASNPLISLFGFSLGALLSGSLVVEVVLSWPGLGPLLLESILSRDLYVVIGCVLFSTLFLVGGNLAADLLLYCADPRIRLEAGDA